MRGLTVRWHNSLTMQWISISDLTKWQVDMVRHLKLLPCKESVHQTFDIVAHIFLTQPHPVSVPLPPFSSVCLPTDGIWVTTFKKAGSWSEFDLKNLIQLKIWENTFCTPRWQLTPVSTLIIFCEGYIYSNQEKLFGFCKYISRCLPTKNTLILITDKAPVALWSLTWIELDLQKRTLQSTFLFKLDFMFQPHLPNFQEKPQINKEEMVSEFTSFCLKAAFYLSWCLLSSLFVYSTSQPANTITVLWCK